MTVDLPQKLLPELISDNYPHVRKVIFVSIPEDSHALNAEFERKHRSVSVPLHCSVVPKKAAVATSDSSCSSRKGCNLFLQQTQKHKISISTIGLDHVVVETRFLQFQVDLFTYVLYVS